MLKWTKFNNILFHNSKSHRTYGKLIVISYCIYQNNLKYKLKKFAHVFALSNLPFMLWIIIMIVYGTLNKFFWLFVFKDIVIRNGSFGNACLNLLVYLGRDCTCAISQQLSKYLLEVMWRIKRIDTNQNNTNHCILLSWAVP